MAPEDVPVNDAADEGDGSKPKEESAKKPKSSSAGDADAKKRKRESTDGDSSAAKPKKTPVKADAGDEDDGARAADEPKKFRRAFGWFVKEKRAEAEKSLADRQADVSELKDLLSQMWENLAPDDRLQYQEKEANDKAR